MSGPERPVSDGEQELSRTLVWAMVLLPLLVVVAGALASFGGSR